jgi:hypothetical protein
MLKKAAKMLNIGIVFWGGKENTSIGQKCDIGASLVIIVTLVVSQTLGYMLRFLIHCQAA